MDAIKSVPLEKPHPVVAVVIPCYRVAEKIEGVLQALGPEVQHIVLVDDACPEGSGRAAAQSCSDPRLTILQHSVNQGVGGAVVTGYEKAISLGATIIVKLDGDGQMDPALIPILIEPIIQGRADYTKGNRFFRLESLNGMPPIRLMGNTILSLMTKLSTGYWNVFDPTNGFTAIHAQIAALIPLRKIHKRYFFESDMLFRLGTLRAHVQDVPMDAIYGDERSSLKITRVMGTFFIAHSRNTLKRLFYNYYLRDLTMGSIQLPLGFLLVLFGFTFGVIEWIKSYETGETSSAGTVMLSALPLLVGTQLILSFISQDIFATPRTPIHMKIMYRFKK